MKTSIIVAMTPERLIGAAGRLPWYLPDDLKRFRKLTMGHAILMGRKTFSSIGRALPGRRNLVISRNANPPATEGVEWFNSVEEALAFAKAAGETEAFVAGGTEIYSEGLKLADRMYITFVQRDFPFQGDTYFPMWDQSAWRAVTHERLGKDLEFVVYERADAGRGQVVMEPGN
jgi:dihydrofolate reductase